MLLEAMPIEDLNDLDLRQDILRFTSPEHHLHGLYVPKPPEYPQQKWKAKAYQFTLKT